MKTAATITIKKPGTMTAAGRKKIASWLRRQSENLLKNGKNYNDTGNYVARWLYEETK